MLLVSLGVGAIALGGFGLYWFLSGPSGNNPASRVTAQQLLQKCASAVGGELESSETSPLPSVRFSLGSSQASLQLGSLYGPALLEYSLPFYLPPVFCLRPASAPPTLFGRGQVTEARSGDAAFDGHFSMRSNNPALVERIMIPEVRQAVSAMPLLLHPTSVRLSITLGANVLRIEAPVVVPDHADLIGFVRQGDSVARAVFSALGHPVGADAGVRVLDAGPLVLAEGSCRVCGDPIKVPPVLCKRCRTPHHRECWEYFGGCAIFACNTREFVAGRAP